MFMTCQRKISEPVRKSQNTGETLLVALPELVGQGFDKILDQVIETGVPFVGIMRPLF